MGRSAAEIRRAVRLASQAELRRREDAAVAVSEALAQRQQVRDLLTAKELEVREAVVEALTLLTAEALAELTGADVGELRRLNRQRAEGGRVSSPPVQPSATRDVPAAAPDPVSAPELAGTVSDLS